MVNPFRKLVFVGDVFKESFMEPCVWLMENLYDEIGPAKVVHVYEPRVGLRAIVVVDNIARGPAIGGIRMAPDVTTTEVFRLARGMTYKNSAADLRHGGGKSGIIADPKQLTPEKKEELIRTFARAIATITDYVPGPDIGTSEQDMAYIYDEIGRVVGLPRSLGGIPLDEIGATAYGCYHSAKVAEEFVKRWHSDFSLRGARIAIEGFGNVGRPAAKFFREYEETILVAASDSKGTIYNPNGIDVDKLIEVKSETGSVLNYPDGEKLPVEACLEVDCDVLIPAARPDSINEKNVEKIKAKMVVEGANVPATEDAERRLHDRKVLCLPCFIANAGGVICGALEFAGVDESQVFPTIENKIKRNTYEVLDRVFRQNLYPRDAAIEMAKERVLGAMKYRRIKV